MSDYIRKDVLRELLKTNDHNRVLKKESSTLEFKASFDWKNKPARAKYLHSIAAYANKKGGYIIYGIKNSPRELVGIDSDFEDLDDADVSSYFNTYLSPSVEFERTTIKIRGRNLGVLYVHESTHKPVVCIKAYDQILSESTIYYRYNSQSDRIKPGDLISLLAEVREKESQRWINLFQNISKIGIDNARIFDLKEGEISTINGGKFILDEKLLGRLKVLDSYTSKEKDGAPAVRIIGDIDTSGTIITKSRYLNDTEIMSDFLEQKDVNSVEEYIKAICYQTSGILPIYYYITKANITIKDAIDLVKKVNKHSQAKIKLLARLEDDSKLYTLSTSFSAHADTSIGTQRKRYYDEFLLGNQFELPTNERQVKSLLEAVLNLEQPPADTNFILRSLKALLDAHYSNRNLCFILRNAIAYLDLIMYRTE